MGIHSQCVVFCLDILESLLLALIPAGPRVKRGVRIVSAKAKVYHGEQSQGYLLSSAKMRAELRHKAFEAVAVYAIKGNKGCGILTRPESHIGWPTFPPVSAAPWTPWCLVNAPTSPTGSLLVNARPRPALAGWRLQLSTPYG